MNLLQQAKNGQREALEELYSSSVQSCLFICKKLLADFAEAEKVCRDIYSRVFSRLERMDDCTDFTEWMKNAAAVACSDKLRRTNKDVFLENLAKNSAERLILPKGSVLNAQETARAVENCFDIMALPERFAAICYYFNGMTISQMAAVMVIPETRAKELLRRGHAELSAMVSDFNNRGIKTTEITLKPVLELSAAMLSLPESLKFNRLNISEALADNSAQSKPTPKNPDQSEQVSLEGGSRIKGFLGHFCEKNGRQGFILAVICGIMVLACIGGIWAATASKQKNDEFVASGSAVSTLSQYAVSSQAASSAAAASSTVGSKAGASSKKSTASQKSASSFIVGKKPAAAPYLVTENAFYNDNGEKEKTETFTYKNNELVSLKTVTDLMSEVINYSWNKQHTVRTAKINGKTVETAQYDPNGNPVKITYRDKKSTTYKWSYTYTKGGYIHTAAYKSARSGKYTYSYNEDNRVAEVVTKEGGDTVSSKYSYNEDGTVKSLVKTDFDGEKITYSYEYDLENLTFRVKGSDGTLQTGKLQKAK